MNKMYHEDILFLRWRPTNRSAMILCWTAPRWKDDSREIVHHIRSARFGYWVVTSIRYSAAPVRVG